MAQLFTVYGRDWSGKRETKTVSAPDEDSAIELARNYLLSVERVELSASDLEGLL
jgi:hypothetical protein